MTQGRQANLEDFGGGADKSPEENERAFKAAVVSLDRGGSVVLPKGAWVPFPASAPPSIDVTGPWA